MTMTQPHSDGSEGVRHARAAYLRELFEPWSLRRLALRTGLTKGVVESRFNGSQDLTLSEIEVLAPVIRMRPEELVVELLAVRPEGTTPGGGTNFIGIDRLHRGWHAVGPEGLEPPASTVESRGLAAVTQIKRRLPIDPTDAPELDHAAPVTNIVHRDHELVGAMVGR